MTSHSAEDKAHWFLPDRKERGGKEGSKDKREREKCTLADGFAAAEYVCEQEFFINTCETAGGFP